jgi:hypothetical protein
MKTQANIAIFLAVIVVALFAYISYQKLQLRDEALDLREQEIMFRKMIAEARLNAPQKSSYVIVHNADGKTYLLDSTSGRTWDYEDQYTDPKSMFTVNEGWHQVLFWTDANLAYTTPVEVDRDNAEIQKNVNEDRIQQAINRTQNSNATTNPNQGK